MKHTRPYLFVILIISLAACGQSTEEKEKANWKTLNKNEYSIQYPNDWNLDMSGMSGTSFVLFSELTSEEDKFGENVNLIVQNLEGQNIDLQEFVEISEEQVKSLITNSQITESETQIKNNRELHSIKYSGDQGIFKLIYKQYYWVKDEQAYILTLTCEADQFEDYKEIGEQIMNSFQIK